jgi:hypothetical protein
MGMTVMGVKGRAFGVFVVGCKRGGVRVRLCGLDEWIHTLSLLALIHLR